MRADLPDLSALGAFHIVGIGGGNMNTIASVLAAMGHRVTGSDLRPSPVLDRLERAGIHTFLGHAPGNVVGADAVSFSAAVCADNVELVEARKRGIPTFSRAEVLAAICATRQALAVSGTHGKTTTTAMLAEILVEAGLRPSYMVGGELSGGRGAARWDRGEWLVVEADESDGTFLRLPSYGALVTSIEADHLDHYGDVTALEAAFARFLSQAPGPAVVCLDDPGGARLVSAGVARSGRAELLTYGASPGASFRIDGVELGPGSASFRLKSGAREVGKFHLGVPGLHNVLNAAGALVMALAVGAGAAAAGDALAAYQNVGRRYELRGARAGVTYIDDYAHNPGKLRAALATARLGPWERVVAVFQPHRYTRTAVHWRELGEALGEADVVLVTGIYPAGEAPQQGVSGRLVADAAGAAPPGRHVEYVERRSDLVARLRELLRPGDLCLSLGAGDITTLADELLDEEEGS